MGRHRTYEEKKELTIKALELYSTGEYTIESCCENVGIAYTSFKDLKRENAEIAELYKKYNEKRLDNFNARKNIELVVLAKTALEKKLSGEMKQKKKTTRYIKSDDGSEVMEVLDVTETDVIPTAADILGVFNLFDKSTKDQGEAEEKNKIRYLEKGEDLNERTK